MEALLPETVLLIRVSVPPLSIPPPQTPHPWLQPPVNRLTLFPETVLSINVRVPWFSMPPPWAKAAVTVPLPDIVLFDTVRTPEFEMPPPLFAAEPPVIVRLEMAAFVTPALTVKTGPPPLTVTRFVRVEPLPVVAPVIVVCGGILRVPLAREIVWAVAKALGSKVILPEPAARAAANASRRLQFGAGELVQFDATPVVVSVLTVTTNAGIGPEGTPTACGTELLVAALQVPSLA